jgi:hypothetical protein
MNVLVQIANKMGLQKESVIALESVVHAQSLKNYYCWGCTFKMECKRLSLSWESRYREVTRAAIY